MLHLHHGSVQEGPESVLLIEEIKVYGVQGTLLKSFFKSVVPQSDKKPKNKLNKQISRSGSVLGDDDGQNSSRHEQLFSTPL